MPWMRYRVLSALVALSLCVLTTSKLVGQAAAPGKALPADAAGFKEFADRVQGYLKLQKTVEASLPPLKTTNVPEMITAYQQALARKIREARPAAKPGDIFTPAACEAFRRSSHVTLTGPNTAGSLAYMQPDAADSSLPIAVNGIYPDSAPNTVLSPELLAAFPALPDGVAYRVVGRTLILVDLKSRLVVDLARMVLPAGRP
jgi:hypothetical protein